MDLGGDGRGCIVRAVAAGALVAACGLELFRLRWLAAYLFAAGSRSCGGEEGCDRCLVCCLLEEFVALLREGDFNGCNPLGLVEGEVGKA